MNEAVKNYGMNRMLPEAAPEAWAADAPTAVAESPVFSAAFFMALVDICCTLPSDKVMLPFALCAFVVHWMAVAQFVPKVKTGVVLAAVSPPQP